MTQHISETVSAITGSALEARKARNETGTRRGEIGSGEISTTVRLEASKVSDNDKEMAARLQRLLGCSLAITERAIFKQGQFVGTQAAVGRVPEMSPDTARAAQQIIADFTRPMAKAALVKALTVMKVSCPPQRMDAMDAELQLEVYADALGRYPADCALEAIQRPRKWFPSLYELNEAAAAAAQKRIEIVNKVK